MTVLRTTLVCIASVELASGLQLPNSGFVSVSTGSALRAASPVALFDMFKESDATKRAKERQFEEMKKMQQKRRDPVEWEKEISKKRNMEMCKAAAAAGNLPEGWGSALDADGDRYFFKEGTQETTWDPPLEEMCAILEAQQEAETQKIVDKVRAEQTGDGL